MAQISINLLPQEFTAEEIKRSKFLKVQAFGVTIILILVFLASLTIALRVLQSQNIKQVQAQISGSEEKISDLKDRQASLFILKDRLTTINQYLGVSSKQATIYKLVSKLIPAQVAVSSETVDRGGEVLLVAVVPDATSLDNLIASLVNSQTNEDRVKEVSIENLSRGKDGIYRVSLKIRPKS